MYILCTTSTFEIMDEIFETVWQALVENGSSRRNHDATMRFWNTLTQRQKDLVHKNIPWKVKEGKFVQYDPIRAIKENSRKYLLPEPEDLNGKRKIESVLKETRVVSAVYRGHSGIYTLAEAEQFGMEIKYGLNFKYNNQKENENGNKN